MDESRTGNLRFSGYIVDLLPILLQAAGLGDVPVEYYKMATNEGGSLVNGTWRGEVAVPASAWIYAGPFQTLTWAPSAGGIGELVNDRADILG